MERDKSGRTWTLLVASTSRGLAGPHGLRDWLHMLENHVRPEHIA